MNSGGDLKKKTVSALMEDLTTLYGDYGDDDESVSGAGMESATR